MDNTKRTALFEEHQKLGAKIIPFAGFEMPVRYSSDKEEHNAVRNFVGLFDVSHMGEFIIKGPKAKKLIQYISSNDAEKLFPGRIQYSCMPNEEGGIIDDLLVYQLADEEFMLVVNASNIEKDWKWIQRHNGIYNAEMINESDNTSLIALQGPKSKEVLEQVTDENLSEIKYYHFIKGKVSGIKDVIISATGYTGAGGFELYLNNEHAPKLWSELLRVGESFGIKPAGLGARDTLRLDMGLCLYGNDIDDTTSPLEAGLSWITKFSKEFVNSDALKKQKENGVDKKLVGFVIEDRGIARKDHKILNSKGEIIGRVTSGTQSPTLGKSIGLGYIKSEYSKLGSEVGIEVRNKILKAKVTKPPFVEN